MITDGKILKNHIRSDLDLKLTIYNLNLQKQI